MSWRSFKEKRCHQKGRGQFRYIVWLHNRHSHRSFHWNVVKDSFSPLRGMQPSSWPCFEPTPSRIPHRSGIIKSGCCQLFPWKDHFHPFLEIIISVWIFFWRVIYVLSPHRNFVILRKTSRWNQRKRKKNQKCAETTPCTTRRSWLVVLKTNFSCARFLASNHSETCSLKRFARTWKRTCLTGKVIKLKSRKWCTSYSGVSDQIDGFGGY